LARWQIQNDIEGLGEPGDQELASREVVDIETGIDGDDELERDTIVIQSTYISRSEKESIQAENELDVTINTGNDTKDAFD
jgi:hypothetical protein